MSCVVTPNLIGIGTTAEPGLVGTDFFPDATVITSQSDDPFDDFDEDDFDDDFDDDFEEDWEDDLPEDEEFPDTFGGQDDDKDDDDDSDSPFSDDPDFDDA